MSKCIKVHGSKVVFFSSSNKAKTKYHFFPTCRINKIGYKNKFSDKMKRDNCSITHVSMFAAEFIFALYYKNMQIQYNGMGSHHNLKNMIFIYLKKSFDFI